MKSAPFFLFVYCVMKKKHFEKTWLVTVGCEARSLSLTPAVAQRPVLTAPATTLPFGFVTSAARMISDSLGSDLELIGTVLVLLHRNTALLIVHSGF